MPTTRSPVFAVAFVLSSSLPASAQWTHRYAHVDGGHHVYLEGYELPTLTAGPMDAAAAPDGRRIAYADRGWLWILDLETSVARQLTSGGALDSRPRWSADGARIVFVRDDGSDTWIAEVDVATGSERVLVDTDAIELDPSRGPDGTLWFASGASGPIRIWRVDPGTGERVEVAGSGRVARRPQATPDGAHLLYLQKGGGPDRIVLRDLGTGMERSVVEGRILSQTEPALSPDGRRVAYAVPQGHGDGWELRVLSLDRPGSTMLLAGGGDRLPLSPSWSADGRWILFSEAGSDEVMRLYRVPVEGGPAEALDVAGTEPAGARGRVRLITTAPGAGGPVAARVSVRDGQGHPFFPHGSQPRFDGQNGRVFFYSAGVAEAEVPAGPVHVTVARGLAVAPVERTVDVAPGATTEVRVDLAPVWDAAEAGWRSADLHFHLNYGGPYRLHPDDMRDVLLGEDLDVATPLVANLHERLGEQQWFGWRTGEPPIVRIGQEVRSHFLGHVGLIGTDALHWPWTWGPGYQVYGQDDRTNGQVAEFARRQGGLASYMHPTGADPFADPRAPSLPAELVADGILGDLQAMEVACLWSDELGTAEAWYHFLNLGWPVVATAGSDVMLNFYRTMAPGSTRAYVHTGGATDFGSYLRGLKAGRSFVTSGPLVELQVEGAGPGETIPAGSADARWTLALHTAVAVSTVEILVNGQPAWTGEADGHATQRFSGTVPLPPGGWIAARVLGPTTTGWPAMDSYAFAHTSPVWIGEIGSVDPEAEARSVEALGTALAGAWERVEAAYAGTAIPELTARFDAARAALEERRTGGAGG